MRSMLTIVCAVAILALAGQALGVAPSNYNFTNAGGDSLWLNAANWLAEDSTTGVPNDYEDDNAWIGGGLTAELREDPAPQAQCATPKRLKLGISDGTAGTLEIHGSELNLRLGWAGYGYIGNNGVGYGDGHVKQYGGEFSTCGFGLGRHGATGTYTLEGGDVTAIGTCGINLAYGREQSGSTGILTQSGGTITQVDGNISLVTSDWVGGMHDCTALYTISGGNLYKYGSTADAGAIALGPTSSRDGCTGNKATFNVVGAWDDGVDNIQINAFRMSAIGDNQAILACDVDGTVGIEKIIVTNAATFDGELVVTTLGSGHAGTYTLMTYASATGDFDTTDLPTGWTYDIGTTALTVTVPEPATLALLGLGGIGVLIRRRRK